MAVICVIILSLQSGQAFALEGSFGLTPAKLRVEVVGGQSAQLKFVLMNNTSLPRTYKNYVTGCTINRDGAREYPEGDQAGRYSAAQWIKITKGLDGSVVYPYELYEITAEINPPIGTAPGKYYAVLFAEPIETTTTTKGFIALNTRSRVGALIEVTVPGPISAFGKRASVTEIKSSMPDANRIKKYKDVIQSIKDSKELSIDHYEPLKELNSQLVDMINYQQYRSLKIEEQEKYALGLVGYLEQLKMEEEVIRVWATLENESHMIIMAKGEAFIYQKTAMDGDRYRRVLRDKFTLIASGQSIKGEAKVFAGGLRDFHGTVQRPLPAGEYVMEVRFEVRGEDEEQRVYTTKAAEFTVPENVAVRQSEMLTFGISTDFLEFDMVAGGYHVEVIEVENLGFAEALRINVISTDSWLEVYPKELQLGPGRRQNIRIGVRIPRDDELIERKGRLILTTDGAKLLTVDVVVTDKRKKYELKPQGRGSDYEE